MPAWGTIIVAVLTITVSAMVNIRIKFASDAPTATRDLIALGATIVQWGSFVLSLVLFVMDVTSKDPLSRVAVARMAMETSTMVFVLTTNLLLNLVALLTRIVTRINTSRGQ